MPKLFRSRHSQTVVEHLNQQEVFLKEIYAKMVVSFSTHETRGNFQKTFPQYQEETITIIIMTTTTAAAAVTILVKKNSRIQKPRLKIELSSMVIIPNNTALCT